MATSKIKKEEGRIVQVIGPVVDVDFGEERELPPLMNALTVKAGDRTLILEVAKHLEPGRVRAVSLGSTDGLRRGAAVKDFGAPIQVPVGKEVLGHVFNVVGEVLDGKNETFKERWPIHRAAPSLSDQSTKVEVFETGIKVIDLLAPFIKGGKIGLLEEPAWGRPCFLWSLSAMLPRNRVGLRFSPAWGNELVRETILFRKCANQVLLRKRRLYSDR